MLATSIASRKRQNGSRKARPIAFSEDCQFCGAVADGKGRNASIRAPQRIAKRLEGLRGKGRIGDGGGKERVAAAGGAKEVFSRSPRGKTEGDREMGGEGEKRVRPELL